MTEKNNVGHDVKISTWLGCSIKKINTDQSIWGKNTTVQGKGRGENIKPTYLKGTWFGKQNCNLCGSCNFSATSCPFQHSFWTIYSYLRPEMHYRRQLTNEWNDKRTVIVQGKMEKTLVTSREIMIETTRILSKHCCNLTKIREILRQHNVSEGKQELGY